VTQVFATDPQVAYSFVEGTPYNQGYDLSRLFAYRWAGLDPQTGYPRGYLNGNIVTLDNTQTGNNNLNVLENAPSPNGVSSSIQYMGSASPVIFGSFRNSFTYKSLSVSTNILYKLKYFFRRPISDVVRYNELLTYGHVQGIEFADRWKKPGDERTTNVPVLPATPNDNIDNFYYNSTINVLKGDHIRLQELNFSYSLAGKKTGAFKNVSIYANLPLNIILWRANKLGLDPDIFDFPVPKSYSLGFRANF